MHAGGKFSEKNSMDRVSLWVHSDPWCDGVAEHKGLYIYI